jgi:hypothetical protein
MFFLFQLIAHMFINNHLLCRSKFSYMFLPSGTILWEIFDFLYKIWSWVFINTVKLKSQ